MNKAERIEDWRERANDFEGDAYIPASQLARDKHQPFCLPHGHCFCNLTDLLEKLPKTIS